jgi:hypothetical protein
MINHGEQSNLLKAIEKDSEMLGDLLHDFTRVAIQHYISIFCFFEQYKSDVGRLLKPRRGGPWPNYKVCAIHNSKDKYNNAVIGSSS